MKKNLFLFALLLHFSLRADIAPDFNLYRLVWHSTHIVVAAREEGTVSRFKVLESWKGDLKKDEEIQVPGLSFELMPSTNDPYNTYENYGGDEYDLHLPDKVPFDRVVLFLQRGAPGEWGSCEDMKISIAWSTITETYAFSQMMNPGPRLLTKTNLSEMQLRQEVEVTATLQRRFLQACAISDAKKRADALYPFVTDTWRHRSMDDDLDKAVVSCGQHGIELLTRILRTDTAQHVQLHLLQELYFTWEQKVCPQFTELLKQEHAFWKTQAPQLKHGWWTEANVMPVAELDYLQWRNGKTYYICAFAKKMNCPEAKKAVDDFRELWFAYPELHNSHIRDQVTETLQGKN